MDFAVSLYCLSHHARSLMRQHSSVTEQTQRVVLGILIGDKDFDVQFHIVLGQRSKVISASVL